MGAKDHDGEVEGRMCYVNSFGRGSGGRAGMRRLDDRSFHSANDIWS